MEYGIANSVSHLISQYLFLRFVLLRIRCCRELTYSTGYGQLHRIPFHIIYRLVHLRQTNLEVAVHTSLSINRVILLQEDIRSLSCKQYILTQIKLRPLILECLIQLIKCFSFFTFDVVKQRFRSCSHYWLLFLCCFVKLKACSICYDVPSFNLGK